MGLTYKVFQSIAYEGLEWGRERGIKKDKQRQKEFTTKLRSDDKDFINTDALNRHWNNLLQESWDWSQDNVKKGK